MANPSAHNVARNWLLAADKNRKPFPEDMFTSGNHFSQENVEKVLLELKTLTDTKVAASPRLCEEDFAYSLQVSSFVRPHNPIHLMRLVLPHSVLPDDASICIFVKDMKRPAGRNKIDYDHTIKHYETLFRGKKIDQTNITFMPYSQFLNDYPSFDARRKLTFLFEKFLVDMPIATRVNSFIGAKLMHEGRAAFPIDLSSTDLPGEVDVALRQVFYQFPFMEYSNKPSIRVGRYGMDPSKMAENIIDVVQQLSEVHEGGSQNIQRLHIRAIGNVSTTVFLYVSEIKGVADMPKEEVKEGETIADETMDEDALTEPCATQSHYIVCADHFILFDDDDYSRENEEPLPHFDKGEVSMFRNIDANAMVKGGTNAAAIAAKAAKPAINEGNMNDMIVKALKKMLGNQNLPSLINGSNRNNSGGGVTANNAIRRRRFNNQGGGNNASFNNGGMRNNANRRFI